MSKLTRRLIWVSALIGAFVAAFAMYVCFFGVQTFFALQARQMARKLPIVKSVPVELEDFTISRAHGNRLSFQGAEFEVPWSDIDEQKTRVVGKWVSVQFHSGSSILLCVGRPNGFISSLSKDKTPDPKVFSEVLGSQVLHSDYTLFKAIYETTPSQITLSTPPDRAGGLSVILMVKGIAPPTTDWAIYNIRSRDVQGFQLGSPTRRPKKMCLDLFTEDAQFEISIFQETNGSTPGITQAELNRIIQTAHKASSVESVLKVSPI